MQEKIKQLPKRLFEKLQTQLERRYPGLIEQRWDPLTDAQKCGLTWFAGAGLVSGAIAVFVVLGALGDTDNTLPQVIALARKMVFNIIAWAVSIGLQAYLISKRSKSKPEPVTDIVTRVVIAWFLVWIPLIGLFLPFIAIYVKFGNKGNVQRGSRLVSVQELQRYLVNRDARLRKKRPKLPQHDPQLEIGGVQLPNYLENLGFFFVGAPGTGKSQALKKMLQTMKQRPDFRAIVLDRNGELLEHFYDEGIDLLFNPYDARSVGWNHRSEAAAPEAIAAALVPNDPNDSFFSEAAKSLLSDLYERCDNNAEIWEVLSSFTLEELADFLQGGVSFRYFQAEKTGASVISTLVNQMRFYRDLPDGNFSFSGWGRDDDPRWLFLPIFENESEKMKPLYSMAFDMMLRGLLSDEQRGLKTAVVIDELGALNALTSLPRLLAEARKFGGTAMLGTQTTAQVQRVYGPENARIILQGTATKLILNCRDQQTAAEMAGLIGKQERKDITKSWGNRWFDGRKSEQIRETYTVMPTELQRLEELQGYLTIGDGSPPAKVEIEPRSYVTNADRLVPAEQIELV